MCVCVHVVREVTELVDAKTHDLHAALSRDLQQRATRAELEQKADVDTMNGVLATKPSRGYAL